MGPPPDLKGKNPFTPYSGFTLGTSVFTHYTTARQRYSPSRTVAIQYPQWINNQTYDQVNMSSPMSKNTNLNDPLDYFQIYKLLHGSFNLHNI